MKRKLIAFALCLAMLGNVKAQTTYDGGCNVPGFQYFVNFAVHFLFMSPAAAFMYAMSQMQSAEFNPPPQLSPAVQPVAENHE